MKLVQDYLEPREYEYAREYETLAEVQKDIDEYIREDREQGEYHSYTVIDEQGEDIGEQEQELFREIAMQAMQDIGLTEDECERELEDYQFNF